MNVSKIRRINNKVNIFGNGPFKLEIGCGKNPPKKEGKAQVYINKRHKGYIGLDIEDYGQEIIWDVENGIPLPNDSCSDIFSSHTFEHIYDFIGVMNECYRVLATDGVLHLVVPHRDSAKAYVPSHIRWFDKWTFDFFQYKSYVDGYQSKVWKVNEYIHNKRGDIHVWMTPIKD